MGAGASRRAASGTPTRYLPAAPPPGPACTGPAVGIGPADAAGHGSALLERAHLPAKDLVLLDVIATCGMHSSVHRATLRGKPVAGKRLLTPQPKLQAEMLEREVLALSRVQHCPNVVRLLGWAQVCGGARQAGIEHCTIVLALAARDLHAHIHEPIHEWQGTNPRGPDARADTAILHGVARGMAALHGAGIAHLDLTPRNVLLAPPPLEHTPWLTDFGHSARFDELTAEPEAVGRRGTTAFKAPELLLGNARAPGRTLPSSAVDLYSFGVLAWSVLARAEPWAGLPMPQIAIPSSVLSGDRPSDVCEGASYATVWRERGGAPAVAELVGICWQQEPGARPTFAEVVAKLDAVVATLST